MADTIGKILDVYVEQRVEEETFLDTYRRIGIEQFKDRVYGEKSGIKESEKVTAHASH